MSDLLVSIRKLSVLDYEKFRELRQKHLETSPHSVSTMANEFKNAPREQVEAILTFENDSIFNFVLGAFEERQLIGMLGFKRETRKSSTLHKSSFWGFFVIPEKRNRGVGKQLLAKALELVNDYEWCELIRVMITTTDLAAIKIAENFGFKRYGTEERCLKIDGEYFDDHYYVKHLKNVRAEGL